MPEPKWHNNQPGWYEVPWPSIAVFSEWVRTALLAAPPTVDLLGSAHVRRPQKGPARTASMHRGLPPHFSNLFL